MKKILLLNYEFPPLGGGSANATYHLLKEYCRRADLKVDLVTSSTDGFRLEYFRSDCQSPVSIQPVSHSDHSENVRLFFLDIGKQSSNLHYQSQKELLTYARKAYLFSRKLVREENYDLIHAFFGIPCGFVAMKLGLPYIVSLRGSDVPFYNRRFEKLDKLVFQRLSKKIWRNADAVVANSEGLRALALKTAPEQQISIIPNGVDTEKFKMQPKAINKSEFVILFVGRMIERKGVEQLLTGFSTVLKGNRVAKRLRLVLAGDGNMCKEYEQLSCQLKIRDSVDFLGHVPHDNLPELYSQADVYILPSQNEGMSNTLLEAMASGLPVVITKTGGTSELFRENGILIRVNSPQDIAEAIERLANDQGICSVYSKKSQQIVSEMSWNRVAAKYLELYDQIGGGKSSE